MNRGSKAIIAAGLAALSVFGPVAGGVSTASAATWRHHHYVYARYHHYRHYAWRRHYYYGPGPILGGLGLLAGTAAALTVGPYPYYYYGPGPYYYGPGPYWW